ncbi:hypothetical protein ACFYO2_36730 [Streptomyces sp. NPDC006602]|uniref:hypothetical protein n=1 Tax=Streptomyces sp. NPDC006602 TaxID=3364751 RepID=UPI0036803C89
MILSAFFDVSLTSFFTLVWTSRTLARISAAAVQVKDLEFSPAAPALCESDVRGPCWSPHPPRCCPPSPILDDVAARAVGLGLEPGAVVAVFRDQIEANKLVQRGPYTHGDAHPPPQFSTVEELAAQIERGWADLQAAGIDGEMCEIGMDVDEAEAELRRKFDGRSFGVALIGGGIRNVPENTVLFERIVNVLIDLQPGIRLSFNTHPNNALEALQRWLDR